MQVAKSPFQGRYILYFIGLQVAIKTNGGRSTYVDLGMMAKRWKAFVDLCAHLMKVSVSHWESTQVHASPGQTKSQWDRSFQLLSSALTLLRRIFSWVLGDLSIIGYKFRPFQAISKFCGSQILGVSLKKGPFFFKLSAFGYNFDQF